MKAKSFKALSLLLIVCMLIGGATVSAFADTNLPVYNGEVGGRPFGHRLKSRVYGVEYVLAGTNKVVKEIDHFNSYMDLTITPPDGYEDYEWIPGETLCVDDFKFVETGDRTPYNGKYSKTKESPYVARVYGYNPNTTDFAYRVLYYAEGELVYVDGSSPEIITDVDTTLFWNKSELDFSDYRVESKKVREERVAWEDQNKTEQADDDEDVEKDEPLGDDVLGPQIVNKQPAEGEPEQKAVLMGDETEASRVGAGASVTTLPGDAVGGLPIGGGPFVIKTLLMVDAEVHLVTAYEIEYYVEPEGKPLGYFAESDTMFTSVPAYVGEGDEEVYNDYTWAPETLTRADYEVYRKSPLRAWSDLIPVSEVSSGVDASEFPELDRFDPGRGEHWDEEELNIYEENRETDDYVYVAIAKAYGTAPDPVVPGWYPWTGGGKTDTEPDPDTKIDDEDTPLGELPEEEGEEVLDASLGLGGGDGDLDEVLDEDVPLADAPETGDSLALYLFGIAAAMAAAVVLKKRQDA